MVLEDRLGSLGVRSGEGEPVGEEVAETRHRQDRENDGDGPDAGHRPAVTDHRACQTLQAASSQAGLAWTKLVKATAVFKPMPRPFPFLHEIGTLDGRKPDIENECDGSAGRFEDAAHRYDCLMRSRKDTDRLKTEMEELFADLCQVPRLVASRRGFRPAVDLYRAEDPP